jgi:predicted dehydrogenase
MKIGIIGCGLIGNKRADSITSEDKIVGVFDLNNENAKRLAEKVNSKVLRSCEDVINSDADVIFIATPHNLLAKYTLEAVKAKKHVLVEKPAGNSPLELKAIISESKKNNCIVKVGYNHRFHPAFQKAYKLVNNTSFGEIMFIRARYGHGGRIGYDKEWRANKEVSGGGELIDQGSHLIDLSYWFLGKLTTDYASIPTYFWDMKVEDNCFLALKSEKNQMAWLHASWTEWKNCFSFEIYGKNAKILIEGLGGSYGKEKLYYYQMFPEMGPPKIEEFIFDGPDSSWKEEYTNFKNAIKRLDKPLSDINDAYHHLNLIQEIYTKGKL